MKCDVCDKEINEIHYSRSYPLLITRAQEQRGVVPAGDRLLQCCKDCSWKPHFHCPETMGFINDSSI